jgi:hypothetical protein
VELALEAIKPIEDSDYDGVLLKPEAQERVLRFITLNFQTRRKCPILHVAKEMGINRSTARDYIHKYWLGIAKEFMANDELYIYGQKIMFDALEEVDEKKEEYGLKNKADILSFKVNYIKEILTIKKMELPNSTDDDIKAATVMMGAIGEKIADYLNERVRTRKVIEQQSDATNDDSAAS